MKRLTLVLLMLASTGCADAIIFGTGTTVGIEVKPTQDGQTELNFAYSRQEVAIMPIQRPSDQGHERVENEDGLAYSVYAWFRLTNRWLLDFDNEMNLRRGVCIRQLFATGRAAKILADREQTTNADPCLE